LNTQKQIVLIVALFFIFVGGCAAYTAIDLPVRAPDQQKWTDEQSIERGALLYANNCRTCHGNKGDGGIGPALNRADFQDQDPLLLRQNRDLVRRTLQCGRAGTLMPAWLNTNGGALNAIQIEHLVNLITAPATGEDAFGNPTSFGWTEAVHFAHNLNLHTAAVVGGDTLSLIARAHGIGPAELAALNNLPVEGTLKQGSTIQLPGFRADQDGYAYTVYKDNETITKVAEAHFVGALIIADLNKLDYSLSVKRGVATMELLTADGQPRAGLFPGEVLALPAGAVYVVTAGDTVPAVAERHGITEEQLKDLNDAIKDLEPDAEIPAEVTELKLPKIDGYIVQGQSLDDVAQTLSGTTAGMIAEANGLKASDIVAIGTSLHLPEDSWGSAAPDQINPGTACVQHAVPASVFQTLPGIGTATPATEPDEPTEISANVTIFATQTVPEFDWIIEADGARSEPNVGGVKVAAGTAITFENVAGLHTITINGTADKPDIGPAAGDKRTITFNEPGKFLITCDYHPAMKGWVWVE
jgi:LysM repeat protein/plastocyanin/mono/diheme cytochrome c family protein